MTFLLIFSVRRTRQYLRRATAAAAMSVVAATPAFATDYTAVCPRAAADQYATLSFALHQIDIPPNQREVDGELELSFQALVYVRQIDPSRPGWVGQEICNSVLRWDRTVINLSVLNEGFMRYYFNDRVLVGNVPRNSVVTLILSLTEEDGGTNWEDYADFSPLPTDGNLVLTLWPGAGNGQTQAASGATRDLNFGQRKRVVGDGANSITPSGSDNFRAGVEFTVSMTLEPASPSVGGAVGGPPPPQVGGITQTPGGRDTGPTGPGQSIGGSRAARCTDYANEAVRQYNAQHALQCGYTPPVWSGDFNHHFNWCMQGSNVSQTDAGWLMREAGLAVCRQSHP